MTVRAVVSCAGARQLAVVTLPEARVAQRIAVPAGGEAPGGSIPLAVSPDGRRLYAAERSESFSVSSYAIARESGHLTHLGTAPLPDSMCYLATDASGRWLFAASYPGSLVSLSRIDADGVVRAAPVQVVPTPPRAHCILPDPANCFVYAACLGGDAVLCWKLGADGLDTRSLRTTAVRPGAGPRHLVFGDQGRRVYLLNELDATLDVFACDPANGALAHRQTLAIPGLGAGRAAAADLHLHPSGRFLYASERTTHRLAVFAVDPSQGTLALIETVDSEQTPRGFAITPDGSMLLCAGLTSDDIGLYAIDANTGRLTRGGHVAMPAGPNWIEIITLTPPG
jgi:6-phosphogluconolactonase